MVPLTSPAFAPPLPIIPITPSTEAWLAMTEEERSDFVLQVNESLTEIQRAMSEGRPHSRIKSRTMDMLSLHFRTLGRVIYLAEELAVHYPGERAFAPDILAVRDVPDVEDDERMAWVVAEEKRGIDLVLELLHRGHRKKDLVENVERYARLGISEYFVYDRARRELQGYRLGDPAERRTKGSRLVSRRYDRIVPQHGMLFSQVLDLGLALMGGNLQFFAGAAELPTSELLLNRITTMMSHVEKRATEAEQKVTEALAAEQKAKDALEAERQQLLRQLRQTLNTLLRARNLCTPEVEEQVDATSDPQKLQQWLLRSLQASSWNEVLSGPHGVPDR
jgi:Uma2 family endonuclease